MYKRPTTSVSSMHGDSRGPPWRQQEFGRRRSSAHAPHSVQKLAAPPGAARARNLDVFNGELIVVRQLLSFENASQCEYHNVFLVVHSNHL